MPLQEATLSASAAPFRPVAKLEPIGVRGNHRWWPLVSGWGEAVKGARTTKGRPGHARRNATHKRHVYGAMEARETQPGRSPETTPVHHVSIELRSESTNALSPTSPSNKEQSTESATAESANAVSLVTWLQLGLLSAAWCV